MPQFYDYADVIITEGVLNNLTADHHTFFGRAIKNNDSATSQDWNLKPLETKSIPTL